MEEEFGAYLTMKSTETLWKRHPRRGALIRVGMVYEGCSSIVLSVQEMWKAGVLCKREQGTGGDF